MPPPKRGAPCVCGTAGVDTAVLAAAGGWRAAMAAATAACRGAPPSSSLSVQSLVVVLEHSVDAEFSEKSSPKKGQPLSPRSSSSLSAAVADCGAAPLPSEAGASPLPTSSSSSSSVPCQSFSGSLTTAAAATGDGIFGGSAALLTGGGGGVGVTGWESLGSGTTMPSTGSLGGFRCAGAGGSPIAFLAKPRGPIMPAPLEALPPVMGIAAALAADEAPVANERPLCCSPRPPW